MQHPKEVRTFETQNVDLATFLILHDVKLLEFRKDPIRRGIVLIRFLDEKQNCLDLERVFMRSEFKKFRDINKYLLGKVHEVRKG